KSLSPEIAAAHEVFDMDFMKSAAACWRPVEGGVFPDKYTKPIEDTLGKVRSENPALTNKMIDADIRRYRADGFFNDFKDGKYRDFNSFDELMRGKGSQAAADLGELRDAVWGGVSKQQGA